MKQIVLTITILIRRTSLKKDKKTIDEPFSIIFNNIEEQLFLS